MMMNQGRELSGIVGGEVWEVRDSKERRSKRSECK